MCLFVVLDVVYDLGNGLVYFFLDWVVWLLILLFFLFDMLVNVGDVYLVVLNLLLWIYVGWIGNDVGVWLNFCGWIGLFLVIDVLVFF